MLSKRDKVKFLNKFKFVEAMNGLVGYAWWHEHKWSCNRCKFNNMVDEDGVPDCDGLKTRLSYTFQNDEIIDDDRELNVYNCCPACVEWLRSPKSEDNSGS